jgi:hypothetical protein
MSIVTVLKEHGGYRSIFHGFGWRTFGRSTNIGEGLLSSRQRLAIAARFTEDAHEPNGGAQGIGGKT